MNKYELALVVSAKVEDEVRDAVVEKAKSYITRYNGTITEVEEWGKKKLAYEIQKMHEGFYYFIQFEADALTPISSRSRCKASWICRPAVLRDRPIHAPITRCGWRRK